MSRERDFLREAEEALRAIGKAAIVVKPTLDRPYSDAPDWTPWTRFMERPAKRAYNLGQQIRRYLKDHPFSPGDRVQWNTTGEQQVPATVHSVLSEDTIRIIVDDNGQVVVVETRHVSAAVAPLDFTEEAT